MIKKTEVFDRRKVMFLAGNTAYTNKIKKPSISYLVFQSLILELKLLHRYVPLESRCMNIFFWSLESDGKR